MMDKEDLLILGAGMTGLSAGISLKVPVFESSNKPGGLCLSYYLPCGDGAYRFEKGGGHWIFGSDVTTLNLIAGLTELKTYEKRTSVFFREKSLMVPFPVQQNIRLLKERFSGLKIPDNLTDTLDSVTMKNWLENKFGRSLCEVFFFPFHDRYTAGLFDRISPQDKFKTPSTGRDVSGNNTKGKTAGYNDIFRYPLAGLDSLVIRLSERCDIRYTKHADEIDLKNKKIRFADGSAVQYNRLVSSVPLNRMLELSGIPFDSRDLPYTSVLVLNIGGARGKACPDSHWIYLPDSVAGFFRIGVYSNVDSSFLPVSPGDERKKVSFYIEKAFPGSLIPEDKEVTVYKESVVAELRDLGYLEDVDVIDHTRVDVAYTWRRPGSDTPESSIALLRENGIIQVGRYGRWVFQGMLESMKEGLETASTL